MKKPLLVALCGTDGVGKSSLKTGLTSTLQARGLEVTLIDKWDILRHDLHPECGFLRDDLDALRVGISKMQGVSRPLFLFWSMLVVMPNLAQCQSDIVLFDGYWMKHAAAELVMGCSAELIEAVTAHFPTPDVTIHLDVDIATALARKRGQMTPYECGCDQSMTEESFVEHQVKVRGVLGKWAREQGWLTLDGTLEREVVVHQAVDAVWRPLQRNHEPLTSIV